MTLQNPRLHKEFTTIKAMVTIYCNHHHSTSQPLCGDCMELLEYCEKRLQCCPFQQDKPTCGKCVVHCYKPSMREKIRGVMRFSGPRMIGKHPLMALSHILQSRKKAPSLPKKR